jgi:hypothetical protein
MKNDEIDFKVGDLVQHKASKEIGVVTCLYTKCANPRHTIPLNCINSNNCIPELIGYCDVSLGFEKDKENVNCDILIKVEDKNV